MKRLLVIGFMFLCSCAGNIDTGILEAGKVTLINSSFTTTIPWNGGYFSIEVRTQTPGSRWMVRVNIDGVESETMECTGTTVDILIPANAKEQQSLITVELMSESKWITIAESTQSSGIVVVNDTKWSRGNLSVWHSKFVFAATEEYGLLFKHNSLHGVASDGGAYSGVTFTPETRVTEWSEIEADAGEDPCRKVEPANTWCLPNAAQLRDLYDVVGEMVNTGRFQGCYFADNQLFFPAAGTRDITTGELGFQKSNGAYWASGTSIEGYGEALLFSLSPEGYSGVDYSTTGNLSSVRCVKMDKVADYVSHTPATGITSDAFDLAVTCKSNMPSFVVRVLGVDNELDMQAEASMESPVAKFSIPKNESLNGRTFKIVVNNIFTGKRVTQAGLSGYATYISRSPAAKEVSGDTFALSVTCVSDMNAFDVRLYTEDKSVDMTQKGGINSMIVRFDVPANNSGAPRELLISVNGVVVDDKITQAYKPAVYEDVVIGNTTWAKGNIIVSSGNFAIGAPKDKGLFFMLNSAYGVSSDESTYSGRAYNPASTSIAWRSIPYDVGADPCALIAPNNKWRLPTKVEIAELNAAAVSPFRLDGVNGYGYADNRLFIPASGYMYWNGGAAIQSAAAQDRYGYVRSSSDEVMGFETSGSFVSMQGKDAGYPVRCVRKVNYADYVSHTPTADQTGEFSLTVVARSDMASFPIAIVGGSLNLTQNCSSGSPSATFTIPTNSSGELRTLRIYVNGIYTGRSIRQANKPEVRDLVWAEGNLAIVNGQYVIGSKTERGWMFGNMSKYGIPYSGVDYAGTVYSPAAEAMAWEDIPTGGVDPCTLVKPLNTWRMPSQQDYVELIAAGHVPMKESGLFGRFFTKAGVFMVGSTGSLSDDDGSAVRTTMGRYWTSTVESFGSTLYIAMQFGSSDASNVTINEGVEQNTAMVVRCVK